MVALNYCKMEQYIMSLSNLKRQQLFLKIQHLTIVCYEIYFIFNMSSSLKCRLDFTSKFDTDTLLLAYVLLCVCFWNRHKFSNLTFEKYLFKIKSCNKNQAFSHIWNNAIIYLYLTWPFMIRLLFMNSNNTFLFQLSELHFCKPIFFEQARV